jgi:uncharacterized membrane protein
MACIAIGLSSYPLLRAWSNGSATTHMLIAWNIGACLYMVAALHMMFTNTQVHMRKRSLAQNEGEWVIMGLVLASAVACLSAVVMELSTAKSLVGVARYFHMGHASFTLATSWLFTQVMFAQQYAHDYYAALENEQHGGIAFPDELLPDYIDFLYLACTIGATSQTADVSFTSRYMRRIGLLHGLMSFFFNTTVLALTVNMASSLI